MGAANALIKPSSTVDVDDANEQLTALGIEPTFKALAQRQVDYWVLPENWQAVQLLIKCQTQWKKTVVSSMAGAKVIIDGLDYQAVELNRQWFFNDEDKADLMARLQILEREAVALLNAD